MYKPLLGHRSSGKFLRIFQHSFVLLMVSAETRNGSYTTTLVASSKKNEMKYNSIIKIFIILFNRKIFPCDCIFYPSIIDNETGINSSLKTEFVDKALIFQRAYKFELFGEKGNYKTELLKYTLSKSEFKWQSPNLEQLLFRTLVKKDLGL